MRYLIVYIARACTLTLFATVLWASELGAQGAPRQTSIAQLNLILQNNPDHRAARWALSQAAYRAEHYDIASYHVQRLLQSSKSEQDLEILTLALQKITNADPWDVNLSFSLQPSSNIRRYTYNDEFETVLGVFTPTGGGQEESGLGVNLGAGLSYTVNLPDRSRLVFNTRLDHRLYDASDLDQTRLRFGLRHESFAIGHSTTIEPYFRLRFDEALTLDRQDVGVHLSRDWWLDRDAHLIVSANFEDRDYLVDDVLSGPFGRVSMRYSYAYDNRTRLGLGVALSRSEPQRDHLKYWSGQFSADISHRFDRIGVVQVFGRYTSSRYDGIFPATNLIRNDDTLTLGVSYQHNTFEIMGARPKVSCQIEKSASNIALYDYETTDCGLTFTRSF